MGYYKQLHIDCEPGECSANDFETCYMQPGNPAYYADQDEEPQEPGTTPLLPQDEPLN